jgi:predicted kinase
MYTVVIEGLYTWDDEASSQGSAKRLAELARQYGFEVKSIVLKAGKEKLLARNAAREYSVPLDEFNMLYSNVYDVINDSEIVIDSTDQTPEETVALLKSVI